MKLNKKLIVGAVSGVVALVVVVAVVLNLGGGGSAEKVFEAQMEAIHGDNSKIEDLGIKEDYAKIALDSLVDSGLTLNEQQHTAAKRALEEFTYKVVGTEEIDENTVVVSYEIDSYNIVGSMIDFYGNPEEYLTEEEYAGYVAALESEDYSGEAYSNAIEKLREEYDASLTKLEPTRVKGTLTYVYSEDEKGFKLDEERYFDDMVKTVLGVSNIEKEAVED